MKLEILGIKIFLFPQILKINFVKKNNRVSLLLNHENLIKFMPREDINVIELQKSQHKTFDNNPNYFRTQINC